MVEEEADESIYWMEMLVDSRLVTDKLLENLIQEAHEILAIVVASSNTSRQYNTQTRKAR